MTEGKIFGPFTSVFGTFGASLLSHVVLHGAA